MPSSVFINVGECAVGGDGAIITTTSIGSCVAIVLYDATAKVGGMAHAMLPTRVGSTFVGTERSAKYVDEAIDRLVEEIENSGGNRDRLCAKLVGGASMFKALDGALGAIGTQNVARAKECLRELGITLESEDTGGTIGRVAHVDLSTGLVDVTTKM